MLWDSKGGNPENISKDNPYDSATWFDFYSFNHVAITAFIYGLVISFIALFGKLTEKTILYGFILANVIHGIDEILNNLFGNNIEEMFNKGQSGLLNEGVSCFLRKGIKQSQNSFINAIASIHNSEWLNRGELEFIENQIINNLTPEIFSILRIGSGCILIVKDS